MIIWNYNNSSANHFQSSKTYWGSYLDRKLFILSKTFHSTSWPCPFKLFKKWREYVTFYGWTLWQELQRLFSKSSGGLLIVPVCVYVYIIYINTFYNTKKSAIFVFFSVQFLLLFAVSFNFEKYLLHINFKGTLINTEKYFLIAGEESKIFECSLNPLWLALVFDLHASKPLRTGPYKS